MYNRYLDADLDGDNDTFDKSAFDKNYLPAGDSVEVSGRAWSPSGLWYGYTGRQLDPETGLMHYRARAYHPTLKQFTRRDPMGYLDSASLYQYVAGRPLAFVDPSGETFVREWWGKVVDWLGPTGPIFGKTYIEIVNNTRVLRGMPGWLNGRFVPRGWPRLGWSWNNVAKRMFFSFRTGRWHWDWFEHGRFLRSTGRFGLYGVAAGVGGGLGYGYYHFVMKDVLDDWYEEGYWTQGLIYPISVCPARPERPEIDMPPYGQPGNDSVNANNNSNDNENDNRSLEDRNGNDMCNDNSQWP